MYQIVRAIAVHNHLTLPDSLHWGGEQWTGQGTIGNSDPLLIQVDTLLATNSKMSERRPDIVIRDAVSKVTTIADVAVAWEPLVLEREMQKRAKYEKLARDMGRRKASTHHRIVVRPLVVGALGSVASLPQELEEIGLLSKPAIETLIANCQMDVLYFGARLLRGHLAMK